jgi:hypothetical protein
VTGTGIGISGFGLSSIGSGFLARRLKAEQPNPEELTTMAVTRHPE